MGRSKRYTDEQFIEAVKTSNCVRQVLHKLGLKEAGGNYKYALLRIEKFNINISHWGDMRKRQGWAKGKKFPNRPKIPLEKILIKNSTYLDTNKLRIRLIKEGILERKCYNCNRTKWLNKPIPLELEHKNGDNRDNRKINLTLLCPNCHALTGTYRGKNKK